MFSYIFSNLQAQAYKIIAFYWFDYLKGARSNINARIKHLFKGKKKNFFFTCFSLYTALLYFNGPNIHIFLFFFIKAGLTTCVRIIFLLKKFQNFKIKNIRKEK